MIVRCSEAHIRDGKRDEFMASLVDLVATFPHRYPGLISHSIQVDRIDPDRVVYQSVWADQDAVRDFAGDDWAIEPVTFPGEDELLRAPLHLRHFETRDIEKQEDAEDFAPLD